MQSLPEERIRALLAPYLVLEGTTAEEPPARLIAQLKIYLDLLLRWNERTNLTAIREPEEIVQRHFGESLFAGLCLLRRVSERASVLDFGAGAGFPGLPIQLLLPEMKVTLAESQGKKVAFLREVVQSLELGCEVWGARVEALPEERRFDVVTLRAVDRMRAMQLVARQRLRTGGLLVELVTEKGDGEEFLPMPGNERRGIRLTRVFHVEHSEH